MSPEPNRSSPVRKKLIEVALPLDEINAAGAREKSVRHGHPSTLHLWWSRKPLAVARAVIFAQMVDDPSEYADLLLSNPETRRAAQRALRRRRMGEDEQEVTAPPEREALREAAAEQERERLFGILKELVKWENTTNETVLERARAEIWQSWRLACDANAGHPRAAELFDRHRLPAFHDPFAGGGALPLEAQRLGLEAHASDLNPVAVLINKAMIEIPPKFAGRSPVNPDSRGQQAVVAKKWQGAQGLAEDVRHYGRWMRDEAEKRIGHLYPPVEITSDMVRERPDLKPYEGRTLKVIAWLWARTVKSPNPAFADVDVPLASTFMLSTKKGKEAYVEPVIEGRRCWFEVRIGAPPDAHAARLGTKLSRGANFRCIMSGSPIPPHYIKAESMAGRMGSCLMAVVAEGTGRVYLPPTPRDADVASKARARWKPDEKMNRDTTNLVSGRGYGFFEWADLFTARQLVALTTFSDLVGEARERIRGDAAAADLPEDDRPLRDGGTGATAYAEAVSVYLGMSASRATDAWSTIASWIVSVQATRGTFARHALPMVWDYAEANPFSSSCGNWMGACLKRVVDIFDSLPRQRPGTVLQADAARQTLVPSTTYSTDPPYYDNIGYADLSDFFYTWLRRSLRPVFPDLFATLAVPKSEELVATPYRHGGKNAAEAFFLSGMSQAIHRISDHAHPGFPVTIYYAFKQSERKEGDEIASTGWETFLDAVIRSGFAITGTWPMRTERGARSTSIGTNALASSIVLVCRRRSADAPAATRREFLTALRAELPPALRLLRSGNVAPVDLAQAAIGPGMGVYTRYGRLKSFRRSDSSRIGCDSLSATMAYVRNSYSLSSNSENVTMTRTSFVGLPLLSKSGVATHVRIRGC